MNDVANDILMHYGMPRRSGRYPWGSGKSPYQHSGDFLSRIETLRKSGWKETPENIQKEFDLTTTEYRAYKAVAKDERRQLLVATAQGLRDKGYSLNEIAEKMGYNNDSSVRSLLNEESKARMDAAKKTADFIRQQIEEKGMIQVGAGTELELNISKEKLNQALIMLEAEGYPVYGGGVPQVTNPGKQTNIKVICPPGTEHKEIYNLEKVHSINDYISYDGGESFRKAFEYPSSLDSKRLKIYAADDVTTDGHTSTERDGIIEIRRGVADLDLGSSKYAQVRIMVDGTHYLKGMAMYSDNMPDGYDVVFNSSKQNPADALKKIKSDPANPFGALIKEHGGQSYYDDPNGKYTDPLTGKKQSLSLINKTREEGDWNEWSKNLPSQFLSKQNITLINKQLNLAIADTKAEFDSICSLTNPTVKKVLLKSFAEDCDSAAVHLKAASLPRQRYQVILPIPSMKDNEVYAPNFKDGETVALIRYPHGGQFEIPILTVNNKQKNAKAALGNALDAVGINKRNAEILSGADFDGDTVMVIPCNSINSKVKITNKPPLKGLEGFDDKLEYPYREGMKVMTKSATQMEMGKISNLICDMTLKGASDDELARAVRHSMVVIDAEKHKLDYKKSEADNGIAALKKKYQGHVDEDGKYHEGASTIISKASAEQQVLKRKGQIKINKDTGELIYNEVHETYIDKKTGQTRERTIKSTRMAETKDAYTLVSDLNSPKERAYADYANEMKSLANQARKEMVNTGKIAYSANAKATYAQEVASLDAKLNVALLNAPKERQAQILANTKVTAQKQANPDIDKKDEKKIRQQALTEARLKVGAKREPINITDKEWEAIQAGAISENKLLQILNNTDIDQIRDRATPKNSTKISTAQRNKIKSMNASGYTSAEIAEAMNLSSTTITKYLNGKE